jgi:hypothetical protein
MVNQKFVEELSGENAGSSTAFGARMRQTSLRMTAFFV